MVKGTAKGTKKRTAGAKSESGVVLIEFVVSLFVLIGFTRMFLQVVILMTLGSYVQYATFMAARAYYAASSNEEDQLQRANDTLSQMLAKSGGQSSRFGTFISPGQAGDTVKGASVGPGPQFVPGDFNQSWMQGVRYDFKGRFSFPGLTQGREGEQVPLTSEAWLGREVTYSECLQEMKERFRQQGEVLIDNGC